MTRFRWAVLVLALAAAGVLFARARRAPGNGAAKAPAPAVSHELGRVAYACQPVPQSGCAAGEKCDLFCGAQGPQFACRRDEGTLAAGQACVERVAGGAQTCARGTTCLGGAGGPVCTKLCVDDADCGGARCLGVTAFIVCPADPAGSKPFPVRVCR